MKFKITTDGTTTRVIDAETGREFPAVDVRFELVQVARADGPPVQQPRLTLTLGGPDFAAEIEGEIQGAKATQAASRTMAPLTRSDVRRGKQTAEQQIEELRRTNAFLGRLTQGVGPGFGGEPQAAGPAPGGGQG